MYLTQLGDLLNAGVTMFEAMNELAVHSHDARLRRLSREIAMGANRGESLQVALARYPLLVPAHVRGMLLVGERAGTLPQACQELADDLRQQQAMHWKVSLGKLWFGMIFFTALLIPGTPRLIRLEGGENLPWWQRPDWAAYNGYLNHVVWPIVLGFIVVWNLVKVISAIPALAEPVQRFLYVVPGARQLIRRAAMIRFMVSLDALLKAGVDLQEALPIAAGATGNVVISRQLERVAGRLRDGTTLEAAFKEAKAVPSEITQSLLLAERAGTYERTLTALAAGYRAGRSRAVMMTGVAAYGIMVLLSAAVVTYVLAVGYTGYFNTLFSAFDEK
jgi:type IV pilus assembly protein PilC